MLEDYFYENISDMTTDYEMFCLTQGAGKLYDDRLYRPVSGNIRISKRSSDWPEWLLEKTNEIKERYIADDVQFSLLPYGVEMDIHREDSSCCVYFPITLANTIINFYNSVESKRPVYRWDSGQPVLLNTQKYHGINAINKDRIIFQIVYRKSYEEVRDMLLDIHDPRKCIGVNYELN